MHNECEVGVDRARFLILLRRTKALLFDFDAEGMFDSAAAVSETIDTLRRHPLADPLDFTDLDEAALKCLEQKTTKDER
jgi:hypothetical protein